MAYMSQISFSVPKGFSTNKCRINGETLYPQELVKLVSRSFGHIGNLNVSNEVKSQVGKDQGSVKDSLGKPH